MPPGQIDFNSGLTFQLWINHIYLYVNKSRYSNNKKKIYNECTFFLHVISFVVSIKINECMNPLNCIYSNLDKIKGLFENVILKKVVHSKYI